MALNKNVDLLCHILIVYKNDLTDIVNSSNERCTIVAGTVHQQKPHSTGLNIHARGSTCLGVTVSVTPGENPDSRGSDSNSKMLQGLPDSNFNFDFNSVNKIRNEYE